MGFSSVEALSQSRSRESLKWIAWRQWSEYLELKSAEVEAP